MPEVAAFSLGRRLLISSLIGVLSGAVTFIKLSNSDVAEVWAGDFTWAWLGAKYLLAGDNPYHGEFPFGEALFYPLPTLFVAIPFTPFGPELAAALFFGISGAILAFAVTRYGYMYLPVFFSASYIMAAALAQWSPLLLAAAFLPVLMPFVITKPSLGAAVAVNYPNRIAYGAIGLIIVVSLLIQPTWPVDWFRSLGENSHPIPLFTFIGPVVLLSALCWRRREARFLLLMALIPQRLLFYDQLLLWLVTRSVRQSLYLPIFTWVGLFGWYLTASTSEPVAAEPWVMSTMYLPATAMVLWNGREDYVGAIGERARRFRRLLVERGTPAQ